MQPITPSMQNAIIQNTHKLIYSNLPISARLTFIFTTPPMPNAGIILPILAAAQTPQLLLTCLQRSAIVSPCRLYRSSPSKCKGVDISCTAAGAANCAAVAPDMENGSFRWSKYGASKGGTLKLAKMVRQSRAAKSA